MFPQVFGKYILERELASGGMAVVYLATLRGAGGFEKRLVVKQIRAELASDEAFVQRFVAEAKTTVELSHPNIVPVYELGVEQGVYFIAMELAEGATLSELLKSDRALSPEEGAYLGVEICRALDYAHRKAGIVHRDVTPRNVLIDEEGAVRLIDFGIAAPVSVEGSARERVYGSPGHMPAEQLHGGRLTPATDVFAVGALLVEAWTGKPPFRRVTRELSDAALAERPPPLMDHDPALGPLDDLIRRAVAPDAADRPQTAEELARSLRDFIRTKDLGDISRRLGERVRRARREDAKRLAGESYPAPFTPSTRRGSHPGSVPPTPITPATRPITQPGTETFASREEVVEWTRAPSVRPPADPAVLLDDGTTARDRPRPKTLRPGRGVRQLIAVAFAGVALAAAAIAMRGRRASPGRGPGPGAPATSIVRPPEPHEEARVPAPAASGEPTLAPAGPLPSSSSEEAAKTQCFINVTSDLPARVTIDGVAQGATPLRGLKKATGKHVIVLVSAELNERLTATVNPKAGDAVNVHAEFTRPVPTLRIR